MPAKISPGLTAIHSMVYRIRQDPDQDSPNDNPVVENTVPDTGNPFAEDIPRQDSATDNPDQNSETSSQALPGGQDSANAADDPESGNVSKPGSLEPVNQQNASESVNPETPQDNLSNQRAGNSNDESAVAVPGAQIPAASKKSISTTADAGMGEYLWLVWILVPVLLAIVIWRVWSTRRRKAAYEKIYKSIADERSRTATAAGDTVNPEGDVVNMGLPDEETETETLLSDDDALATVEANFESTVGASGTPGEELDPHLNPAAISPTEAGALDDDDVIGIGDDQLDSDEFDFDADDDEPLRVSVVAETSDDIEDSSGDVDVFSLDDDDDDFASFVDDSDGEFDFSADEENQPQLSNESRQDAMTDSGGLASELTDVNPGLAASHAPESDSSTMESQFPDDSSMVPAGSGPALKTVRLAQAHQPQISQSTTGEPQHPVDQQLKAELSELKLQLEQLQSQYDALANGHETELQQQRHLVDSLQAEKTELQRRLKHAIEENEKFDTETSLESRDLESIQTEVDSLKVQLTGLQAEKNQLTDDLAAANTRAAELDQNALESAELSQNLQQALDDLSRSKNEKLSVEQQLELTQNQLKSARQIIHDMETAASQAVQATVDSEMEHVDAAHLEVERQKRLDAEMMLEQAEEQRTEVAVKLAELRRELKSVQSQAADAAHGSEVEEANLKLEKAESVNAELASKLETQEKFSKERTEQLDALKLASAQTDSQVIELEKEISGLRVQLEDDSVVRQLTLDRDRLSTELETAAINVTALAAEKSGLQSELSSSQQVAQQLGSEIDNARNNLESVKRQAEEQLSVETESIRGNLDRIRQQQQRQLSEATQLEKSFNDVMQKNRQLEDNARARESELHLLRQQLMDVQQNVAAAERDRAQIDTLQSSLRQADRKIQELREQLDENRRLAEQVDSHGQHVASGIPGTANPGPGEQAMEDLTKISGIDARLSNLLHHSGIRTFANLSAAKVGDLRKILGVENLQGCDPKLWKKQATMAKNGKWKKLLEFQDELNRNFS